MTAASGYWQLDGVQACMLCVGLLAAWLAIQKRALRTSLPGPPSLPLVGSLPWLGRSPLHIKARELGRRYGSPFQIDIGMQRYVVSAGKDAKELLMNTGRHEAFDRPDLLFYADELGTKQWFPPSVSSDEPFVQVSRLLASKLRRKVRLEPSLRASQDVLGLLFDKLDTPIDMDALVQLYTRSTSLEMGFGIKLGLSEIESHKETQQLYACVQDLLRLYDTTAEWTVLFPFLRWLLPQRNARRRREAKQVFERFQQAALTLSMQYKDQIMTDQGRFTADSQYHYAKEGLANKLAEIGEPEAVIQGAGVIAAISDTTTSSILTCLGCIAYDHELQDKIHAELDEALHSPDNTLTLPSNEEEVGLPFTTAVLLESMRMFPFNPMGFSRRMTQDVALSDSRIVPKGSIIMPLNDDITRDPHLFKDPNTFDPSRHLGNGGRPLLVAFGFGSRSCPGQDLAVRNMMTLLTRIMYLYTIRFEQHEQTVHGKTLVEVLDFESSTLMRRPRLPRFKLTPRFPLDQMRMLLQ